MAAKLYVILGSHACRTGMLLLEHKRVEYDTVELPTLLHPVAVRLAGFSGERAKRELGDRRSVSLDVANRLGTVPALKIDGARVQTNRAIARHLERLRPDPPLFPAEPERRGAVEDAETWGDEVFQMVARRLVLTASRGGPDAMHRRGDDGRLGPLLWHRERVRSAGVSIVRRSFVADERAHESLRAQLPGMLDRIDGWIDAGVLNGPQLNAADYMLVSSLALLTYANELRPEIEQRRAIELLDRVLPEP